jgi:hypothetical protein
MRQCWNCDKGVVWTSLHAVACILTTPESKMEIFLHHTGCGNYRVMMSEWITIKKKLPFAYLAS